MNAYLVNSNVIDIDVDTLFDGNPEAQLDEANAVPFLIDIVEQRNRS